MARMNRGLTVCYYFRPTGEPAGFLAGSMSAGATAGSAGVLGPGTAPLLLEAPQGAPQGPLHAVALPALPEATLPPSGGSFGAGVSLAPPDASFSLVSAGAAPAAVPGMISSDGTHYFGSPVNPSHVAFHPSASGSFSFFPGSQLPGPGGLVGSAGPVGTPMAGPGSMPALGMGMNPSFGAGLGAGMGVGSVTGMGAGMGAPFPGSHPSFSGLPVLMPTGMMPAPALGERAPGSLLVGSAGPAAVEGPGVFHGSSFAGPGGVPALAVPFASGGSGGFGGDGSGMGSGVFMVPGGFHSTPALGVGAGAGRVGVPSAPSTGSVGAFVPGPVGSLPPPHPPVYGHAEHGVPLTRPSFSHLTPHPHHRADRPGGFAHAMLPPPDASLTAPGVAPVGESPAHPGARAHPGGGPSAGPTSATDYLANLNGEDDPVSF